jgi:hypothetical protein
MSYALKSNKTKTPKTDAIKDKWAGCPDSPAYVEELELSLEQLELELAEAKAEIRDLRGDVEAWKRETLIANARLCGEKHPDDNGIVSPDEIIPKLQRELAEAIESREFQLQLNVQLNEQEKKTYNELVVIREQNNELVKDKLRLNWLLNNCKIEVWENIVGNLERYELENTRAAIDEEIALIAMEEGQL